MKKIALIVLFISLQSLDFISTRRVPVGDALLYKWCPTPACDGK